MVNINASLFAKTLKKHKCSDTQTDGVQPYSFTKIKVTVTYFWYVTLYLILMHQISCR